MNLHFLIFESGAILMLLAILFRERKKHDLIEVILLASVYGIILETFDIYMSGRFYVYNSGFLLEIAEVPLAIGAGWAIAYYLSLKIAGRFSLTWWQSPFLMALIAFLYDLSMDAIAIRAGFWSWQIALDEQWFGVPYINFFGWLAVMWTFALFMNLSRQDFVKPGIGKAIRYLSPIVSSLLLGAEIMIFIGLSLLFSGIHFEDISHYFIVRDYSYIYIPEVQETQGVILLVVIMILVLLSLRWIKKKKESVGKVDRFVLFCSVLIHLMFLFMLLAMGIYRDLPMLLLVSLAAISADLFFETYPQNSLKKNGC